ncbi:ATP-binding protein [Streptomyces sp. NPDC057611]|uniref:ATP-binding protein n=1 Tax=Streptomyces sp. NPDC057611 TaxID=3346182 RepID=UPI0036B228F4
MAIHPMPPAPVPSAAAQHRSRATARTHGHLPGSVHQDPYQRQLALVSTDPEDVKLVRRLAKSFFKELQLPPAVCDDALLIISELVTNAVLHAAPPAVLRLRRIGQRHLLIEVSDGGPQPSRHTRSSQAEEQGRGLQIVAALALRYGTIADAEGVTRWAELKTA